MKAPQTEQKKLLDLQTADVTLAQLLHREKNLPEDAALNQATSERDVVASRLAVEVGKLEDAEAELARFESDAATVAARMQRDEERLQKTSSVKDVTALEAELESLRRRTSELEDKQLEVMERVDEARQLADGIRAENADLTQRIEEINAQREASLSEIAAERGTVIGNRKAIADSVPDELLDLYETQRAKTGVGAALFRAGTCGGCTMSLTGQDLADVRAAALDEVVRCPECGCIVIRTEESGLW